VFKAMGWDLNPLQVNGISVTELLATIRLHRIVGRKIQAKEFGISISTLKDWERGRTHPNRKFWATVRQALKS